MKKLRSFTSSFFNFLFRRKTIYSLVHQDLEAAELNLLETERALMEVEHQKEYFISQEALFRSRISRLQRYLAEHSGESVHRLRKVVS